MTPAVVGKIEDGAEGDVSFIRTVSFDSIVDATGVYWEGVIESMDAVREEARRETIQPCPKVIAFVEFTRCRTIRILCNVSLGSCLSG